MTAPADLRLWVTGDPAPQGSKAYKGHRHSKRLNKDVPVLVESSKALTPWRNAVQGAAAQFLFAEYRGAWKPLDCAVAIDVTFVLPRGSTVTRDLPTVPPDLDKLQRGILDGLTDGRVLTDDARVVEITARKVYASGDGYPRPGADVRIATVSTPAPTGKGASAQIVMIDELGWELQPWQRDVFERVLAGTWQP